MTSNELTSLPSDLFVDMLNLKVISFGENKLEFLTSKLLQPIIANGHEFVDFRGNASIDAFYATEKWKMTGSIEIEKLLEIIDTNCKIPLEENHISKFKKSTVSGFGKLWETCRFSDVNVIVGTS